MPCSVTGELEKIMRDFLWGSTSEKRQFHLISWEQICILLKFGGLGLRRLRDVNVSLLCKWLWALGSEENKLWKRIITEKYGVEKGG